MYLGLSHQERTRTEGKENRVLSKIFGSKREEVRAGRRELYDKFHDFSSSNIIWVIKLRNTRQAVCGMYQEANTSMQGFDGEN
jgi:hypothetical protein